MSAQVLNYMQPLEVGSLEVIAIEVKNDIKHCQDFVRQYAPSILHADHMVSLINLYCFTDHGKYLAVKDTKTEQIVAVQWLTLDIEKSQAAEFSLEHEFDITKILFCFDNVMELGQTVIHPDYTKDSIMGVLWQTIKKLALENHIDCIIGKIEISLDDNGRYAAAVINYCARDCLFAPADLQCIPLDAFKTQKVFTGLEIVLPELLTIYLNYGAQVCGEAYKNSKFNSAELMFLIELE